MNILILVIMTTIFGGSLAGPLVNIILIVADDLGWNDVSFHGSNQFMTPNIDALAYSGVILNDYYTQPICTPARAALLTGRHPIHNGMEHDVIYASQPWGLPLSEKLLPEYLKPLGYVSRAIGKWHLGFFKSVYTPSKRSFDTHYGNWLGEHDHFTHYGSVVRPGFDFRRELNITRDVMGKYAADVFTEEAETIINNHDTNKPLFLYVAHVAPHAPLQAPKQVIDQFQYISKKKRQKFSAMVTKVDESVGRITKALKEKNILNNSIIIFITDNGGATNGYNGNIASNYPLRGCKDTLWEGGVRGVGLVWSPLLQGPPRVHRGLVNVQDWLPTLLSAVNYTQLPNSSDGLKNLDGISQWDALNDRSAPPYTTMLHNIDPVRKIAALRRDDWKLVLGRTYNGKYDGHYGQLSEEVPYDLNIIMNSASGQAIQSTIRPLPDTDTLLNLRADATVSCQPKTEPPHVIQVRQTENNELNATKYNLTNIDPQDCQPHVAPCLFDVSKDPCELINLATLYPSVVNEMVATIAGYQPVPPNNKPGDPRSYPINWNNAWISWQDYV